MSETTRNKYPDSLGKKMAALHVFTDTFSIDAHGQPLDFDAELTTDARHGRIRDTRWGINGSHILGAYGVDLVDQLVGDMKKEIALAEERSRRHDVPLHPDIEAINQQLRDGTICVIANSAPRTGDHKNGSDFWLAVTRNGVEVYATPTAMFAYVRDRIEHLFRIPNEGHPIFDGEREQFRSSIVARTREVPWHLQPIKPELISAHLPEQRKPIELSYADVFGNTRWRAREVAEVCERIGGAKNHDDIVGLKVVDADGTSRRIHAHVVECLDEIPGGKWGIYTNVADGERNGDPGFFEVNLRWAADGHRVNGYQKLGRPDLGAALQFERV